MDSRERVLAYVDEAIAPDNMTKSAALEWLEDLISELEVQADCLRDELRTARG